MYDIFISYRKKGGVDFAGRICASLEKNGYHPFYDCESMKSGRFDSQLYNRIDECEHFLLILPPKGLNRCIFKRDWVRKEIEYALKKKKHIIVIQMNGYKNPIIIPKSISAIVRIQAIMPQAEMYDAYIQKLVEYIKDTDWSFDEVERPRVVLQWKKIVLALTLFIIFIIGCFTIAKIILPRVQDDSGSNSKVASYGVSRKNDSTIPTIVLIGPEITDDSLIYFIYFDDETEVAEINLTENSISTIGFVGNISINGDGIGMRKVSITDYQIVDRFFCSIKIAAGVVVDTNGNKSKSIESRGINFSIPIMSIALTSKETVKPEDSISFDVAVLDNVNITYFDINANDIIMNGFTGNIAVTENNDFSRRITFSNVKKTKGNISEYCYFTLPEGIAKDSTGNQSKEKSSPMFIIE